MNPADLACTLPPHLKPKQGQPPQSLMAELRRAIDSGQRPSPVALRDGLGMALGILLGQSPSREGLARFFAPPWPTPPGWADAVNLVSSILAQGGFETIVGAHPAPPAPLDPGQVLAEAGSHLPLEVVVAMRQAGIGTIHIAGADGTWAAVYVAGSTAEVEGVIAKLSEPG